jgi:SRSO17 transposase
VTLSIANHQASLPIAYRLYLPEEWANDAARRSKAHVPDDVKFRTKPEIALRQIRAALMAGVARGIVLTDAAYGSDGGFRAGVTEMGLIYAVAVQSTISVWPPGMEPLPPKPWSGRGRKPSRARRDADHRPVAAKTLATTLPKEAWRDVSWREGSNQTLTSRFAAVRIRPATRDGKLTAPQPLEWLLIEWPENEREPTKYWLSTLPEATPIEVLVDTAKLRWRIERDYEELKSELGLAHFEGRGWRGFHHHATLCIAAYGFLIRERAAFPPSGPRRREGPVLPRRPRPRGAPDPTRAPRRELDRHHAKATDRRPRQVALPMSLLPIVHAETAALSTLMTQ